MTTHGMMAKHVCVLAISTVALLVFVHTVALSEDNPCKRGIKLFALREAPEGHTLKSPMGRSLPVKKDPVLVLRRSDIHELVNAASNDKYVPELRKRLRTPESITVILSDKGTRKLAALVSHREHLPVLYASCDGQVAAGTATYPLNFDDLVAREGRGFLFIDNNIDPMTAPSPRP